MTAKEEIVAHKRLAESQFVLSIYKNPELVHDYEIEPTTISDMGWRIYYYIARDLINHKKLAVLDSIVVEGFVKDKGGLVKDLYDKSGGWDTIAKGKKMITEKNIESFYADITRYQIALDLIKKGFPIEQNWEQFKDMSIADLNDALEGEIASIFVNSEINEDKVLEIMDGIDEMIEEADKGINSGLPFASDLLNSIQNGQVLGNITMLAGHSGLGKTFMLLTQTIPVALETGEPLMIMANEEDLQKWQRDLLTWTINNVLKGDFKKERFNQGAFTPKERELINEAKTWISERIEEGLIRFVNFGVFSMDKAIRYIKKYNDFYGVKYFIIDTLKLDNDTNAANSIGDKSWLQLQQNMVKLYNVIKPTAKNCHVLVTYQLNKSQRGRYLSQNDLGMSKNVADVVSSLILMRMAVESEKGEKGLQAKTLDNKIKWMSADRDYFIMFWDKNRQGNTSEQAVVRVDRGRNIVKDLGKVRISQDFN